MKSIKTLMISAAMCGAMALPVFGIDQDKVRKIAIMTPALFIIGEGLVPIMKVAGCKYSVTKNEKSNCPISSHLNGIIKTYEIPLSIIKQAIENYKSKPNTSN